MAHGRRVQRRLSDELPDLLAANVRSGDQPRSLRALAEMIGVNQSYLSRVLGAKGARPVSRETAAKIAAAFGLPRDYFAEYRAAVVIEAARDKPWMLDPVYDRLARQKT